ncbi:Galactose-binding-like protein [Gracilaria domingensis]|nr:Galactose-binding-like protein [Gracilaria domingensis]
MARHGFGEKTFGLPYDSNGMVSIALFNTATQCSSYVANLDLAKADVRNFYQTEKKFSDHYLVIIPTDSPDPRDPESHGHRGPPCVGYINEGICFAVDYEGFDIQYVNGNSGKIQKNKWLGGIAHELGHGLNLPHNGVRKSQRPEVALMGHGNEHFTQGEVFLTKASCAVLNNCQVFSDVQREFRTKTNPEFSLRNLHITFGNDSIYINSAYDAKKRVNAVTVYVDDFDDFSPVGDDSFPNGYYDAESWCVLDVSEQTFSLTIPTSEIERTHKDVFYVRIWYLFEDGTYHEEVRQFRHKSAADYAGEDYHFEKRDSWILSVSSQNSADGLKEKMIDGQEGTFWSSQQVGIKYDHPHTIEVMMGYTTWLRGLSFRQSENIHCIKACSIYVADTESPGIFQKVMDTKLQNTNIKQFIEFPKKQKAVGFKVVTHSAWDPYDPKPAALAEIGAW